MRSLLPKDITISSARGNEESPSADEPETPWRDDSLNVPPPFDASNGSPPNINESGGGDDPSPEDSSTWFRRFAMGYAITKRTVDEAYLFHDRTPDELDKRIFEYFLDHPDVAVNAETLAEWIRLDLKTKNKALSGVVSGVYLVPPCL